MAKCKHCNGMGRVSVPYKTEGFLSKYRIEACQHCEGKGEMPSVFDQKWHRQTLWAMKNALLEYEAKFLEDSGWEQKTCHDLGINAGIILWCKTIEGVSFRCDRATALAVAHAEMFDKGPSDAAQPKAPMEPPHDSTQPTQTEGFALGSSEPKGELHNG